jgi:hypothetical protein
MGLDRSKPIILPWSYDDEQQFETTQTH